MAYLYFGGKGDYFDVTAKYSAHYTVMYGTTYNYW